MKDTRWVRCGTKDGKQMWRGATLDEIKTAQLLNKLCHHLFGDGALSPLNKG